MSEYASESFSVYGREELYRVYKKLERFGMASKDLKRAMRPASRLLVRATRKHAPIGKTKNLYNSIKARTKPDEASVRVGGYKARYAPVVHFGWQERNIEPNHFMWRALEENEDKVADLMLKGMKKIAKEQGLYLD